MTGREQRLSETFVELADTLVGDFDVADFLDRLVERCTELFEVDESGLVLADAPGGNLRVMAATSEATHLIELLQIQIEQGPCLDSFQSGLPVMAPDLGSEEAKERWPTFAQAATEAGFGSVAALPMRVRDQVIGALNLFRARVGELPPADVSAAQALADVATISLLQDRVARDSKIVIGQLQGALNSRVVIEQAKGILAHQRGVPMGEAFAILRRHARDNNQRLSDVARGLIDEFVLSPFTVTPRIDGRTGVVTVVGELDLATAPLLDTALDSLKGRVDGVVLEMSEVSFIDLAGLRPVLTLSHARAWIRTPSRSVRRLLELIHMDELLEAPDQSQAATGDRAGETHRGSPPA